MSVLQEHFNFYGEDASLGPIVLSVKAETVNELKDHSRVILRLVRSVVSFTNGDADC